MKTSGLVLTILAIVVVIVGVVSVGVYYEQQAKYEQYRANYALDCLVQVCLNTEGVCSDATVKACTVSSFHLYPVKE